MQENRINELRREKGLSQTALAEQLGVAPSTIGMYERGQRDPDTKTLLRLAQAFDCSVDYLIKATELRGHFDIDTTASNIAKQLLDNPALMFSADCYTEQELSELCLVIESTVKKALKGYESDGGAK